MKPHPDGRSPSLARLPLKARILLVGPVVALAVMTVLIGAMPEPFVQFATHAAEQLLDPTDYITTVLGEGAAQ